MKHLRVGFLFVISCLLVVACGQVQTSVPSVTPPSPDTIIPTSTPTSTPKILGLETVSPVTGLPQGTDGYPWWNDSVFYEIFVRSFYDSNGDGVGDFNGITAKLDYLNDGDPATTSDLGVTGIWLMPVFPSPSYHGYDVTDYYAVNPDYGTMDDFANLVAEAHKRGIRIILDLVLNHTSDQNPWFLGSWDPASPYHDWYIWSDTDPGYPGPWGEQVWHPSHGMYYYGLFTAQMPDLNYSNPEVGAEMLKVVQFWLKDVGVDGFRLDAAKHLIEEGTLQANSPSTHSWYKNFRLAYKQINPQAVTVGEVWEDSAITSKYLQGDELDLAFDFYTAQAFISSVNSGNSYNAKLQLKLSDKLIPNHQYATFLTNHDQDRVLNQLGVDLEKAGVAASLLLTAPGVPFLYYGEEVGMQGTKPDPYIRRPMQWSTDIFAGFSNVNPWESVGPGWEISNVSIEASDPGSLLNHYRSLIQARNQHVALRVGNLNVVSTGNNALFSILRVSQEEAVLVLINLTGKPVTEYKLALQQSNLAQGNYTLFAIIGEGDFAPLSVTNGGFSQYVPIPSIPAYATIILQLQLNTP